MKLFERFDEVFCVNLDRRPDRLKNFDEQVKNYNLGNYTRISAIDGKLLSNEEKNGQLQDGELGLLLTIEKIIDHSIKNNYNQILIVEDDCSFSEDISNINEYFLYLPDDWDLLYMGGNHNTHIGVPAPKQINTKVLKLHHTYSAHFVGIKNTVFNIFKQKLAVKKEPIDVSLANIQKLFNAYSFYPAIVKQYSNFSDIQNKLIDYNWLIN